MMGAPKAVFRNLGEAVFSIFMFEVREGVARNWAELPSWDVAFSSTMTVPPYVSECHLALSDTLSLRGSSASVLDKDLKITIGARLVISRKHCSRT